MLTKSERLQVLIERDQRERLEREAATRGTSVRLLVREAIDLAFPPGHASRGAAADCLLAAEPMKVPRTVSVLLAELEAVRGRRR
jgi:hypothetical protein